MKTIGRCVSALLIVLAFAPSARSQQPNADSIFTRCVGTDTTAAWMKADSIWSSEQGAHWSNDALRRRLLALGDSDQAVRRGLTLADSLRDTGFVRRMNKRDSLDATVLRRIIAQYGWPGKSLVGAQAASAAFLIAQHNASLQPKALQLMRRLPPGEVKPSDLAMLEDRVNVNRGRPQRFGTQLVFADSGRRMLFSPIDDLAHLDARRTAVGLPPIPVYLCLMREMYGREIKDPRAGPR